MKPSVDPGVIEGWLRRRWGEAAGFHRLTEGLESQAFGFRCGRDDLVVRINRSAAGFWRDAYAVRAFGRPGLPIPEVLEIATLDDGHAVCISRRTAGVRLHDLGAADMERVAPDVAGAMDVIAASDVGGTTGFGRLDPHGVAPYSAWRAYLAAVADPGRYDWRAVASLVGGVVPARAVAAVRDLSPACPEGRALVHGDFGSYNVLSDARGVTAVIDWNLLLIGDPLYEWANLLFWDEAHMRPVLAAFGARGALPHCRERLLCYQLRIGLEEMHQAAAGENPVDLEWLCARCAAILQQAGLGP